jgi:hypothetical protein
MITHRMERDIPLASARSVFAVIRARWLAIVGRFVFTRSLPVSPDSQPISDPLFVISRRRSMALAGSDAVSSITSTISLPPRA